MTVYNVFFAQRLPISFRNTDTITDASVVISSRIILSSKVFLNAVQKADVENIFVKCPSPIQLGWPTGL